MSFFDASLGKSDFKTALKWLTAALIQSPYTLNRSEIGTDKGDGTRQLTPYEIAAELAYTYTGTSPSDDLLAAAKNNSLGDLAAQARTMMSTSQGQQAVQHFFEQYLEYASVTSLQKPNISNFASVSQDMAQETRAFINDVVLTKGGGLKELLSAQTTNPSKALASYYAGGNGSTAGFPTPSSDYASVVAPGGDRRRRAGARVVPVDARRCRSRFADQARPVRLLQAVLRAEADAAAQRSAARHQHADGGREHDARPLREGARAHPGGHRLLPFVPPGVRPDRLRVRALRRGGPLPDPGEDLSRQLHRQRRPVPTAQP